MGGWTGNPFRTRWGCFLPDLTRLASGTSAANLPGAIWSGRRKKARGALPLVARAWTAGQDCARRQGFPIMPTRHAGSLTCVLREPRTASKPNPSNPPPPAATPNPPLGVSPAQAGIQPYLMSGNARAAECAVKVIQYGIHQTRRRIATSAPASIPSSGPSCPRRQSHERILCFPDIKSDGGILVHGGWLLSWIAKRNQHGTSDAPSGRRPPYHSN